MIHVDTDMVRLTELATYEIAVVRQPLMGGETEITRVVYDLHDHALPAELGILAANASDTRRLDVALSDQEIAARVSAYEQPPRADEHVDVAIRKYAKLVGSASEGAVAL